MTSEIGWTKEDSEYRRSRVRAELHGFLVNTADARLKRAEVARDAAGYICGVDDCITELARENAALKKAIQAALDWDERRKYVIPYSVRDPLRAGLEGRL